jgi:hypothetical protein
MLSANCPPVAGDAPPAEGAGPPPCPPPNGEVEPGPACVTRWSSLLLVLSPAACCKRLVGGEVTPLLPAAAVLAGLPLLPLLVTFPVVLPLPVLLPAVTGPRPVGPWFKGGVALVVVTAGLSMSSPHGPRAWLRLLGTGGMYRKGRTCVASARNTDNHSLTQDPGRGWPEHPAI